MGMPTRSPKPTPHTTRDPTACCNDSRVMAIPAFAIAKIGTATKLAQPCNRCSSHSTVDTDDFASRTVMAACPTSDTSASSSWSMSSWRVNGCVGASRPMTTPASVGWTPASYKVHQSTTPRAPYTPIAVHPPRRRTTTVTMASAAAINSASAARKSQGGRTIDRRTGVGHIVEHFTGFGRTTRPSGDGTVTIDDFPIDDVRHCADWLRWRRRVRPRRERSQRGLPKRQSSSLPLSAVVMIDDDSSVRWTGHLSAVRKSASRWVSSR